VSMIPIKRSGNAKWEELYFRSSTNEWVNALFAGVDMVHKIFPYVPCINNENCLMHPADCLSHPSISSAPPRNLRGMLSNLGGALSNLGYLCI
jgi:hypothetical protein